MARLAALAQGLAKRGSVRLGSGSVVGVLDGLWAGSGSGSGSDFICFIS